MRHPAARLRALLWPQRKLFLLVFLWTSLCLVLLKSGFFETRQKQTPSTSSHLTQQDSALHRKRAAASLKPVQPPVAGKSLAPPPSLVLDLISLETDSPHTHKLSTASKGNESQTKQQQQYEQQRPRAPPAPAPRPDIAGASCRYEYPSLLELQFNNIHWQKFSSRSSELAAASSATTATSAKPADGNNSRHLKPATFYLYNAYYDNRARAGQPSVRVLAMVNRIHPPPVNCLLWPAASTGNARGPDSRAAPAVTRAQFVYAWYPKWGNYEDGFLQPWIVTCPVPRELGSSVPESVSLVEVPVELGTSRERRHSGPLDASIPMPPSVSSSSSAAPPPPSPHSAHSSTSESEETGDLDYERPPTERAGGAARSLATTPSAAKRTRPAPKVYDCASLERTAISNNLPVFNRRPVERREKFAVCVKGLDFPSDDEHVSVRLVEWLELLSLLGAKKVFLYNLNVHENISRVLRYYEQRGLVELTPLTLPGDQPNLPEVQHLYLKQKLTSKRQNELLPYNDCLYRNLYSYQYLALLDIDEIIMPLKREHSTWYDLMGEVERLSLSEQNYSRASYNVRNVYFFDDLSGPLGTTHQPASSSTAASAGRDGAKESIGETENEISATSGERGPSVGSNQRRDSAERGIPHYLHMLSHVYRSKNYTEPGQYVKCFHNTDRVISLHNHFPMNCFGQCTTYSIPVDLAHLQHYRKDCVGPLRQSCKSDFRLFTTRDTTIWKYKQRMIKRTGLALARLGLLGAVQPSDIQL